MQLEQKNSPTWRPSASLDTLRARAKLIARIREFFSMRDIWEVETPLLSPATVTDPFVVGIRAETGFLQTSPEYAMKRLLAAGSGSIFQICKAFRHQDIGTKHNPEFTMLEWYHLGFDHHQLMEEVDALLQFSLDTLPADRISCFQLYQTYLGIDPHTISLEELTCVVKQHIHFAGTLSHHTMGLELLFTHCIEPHIAHERPLFLYDFPIYQAALAKIRHETPPIASRFEVYFKGLELANGFHELQHADEQRKRFEKDIAYRQTYGLPSIALDEYFLAALASGLPNCAGVALGLDRLVMLALGKSTIREVVAYL